MRCERCDRDVPYFDTPFCTKCMDYFWNKERLAKLRLMKEDKEMNLCKTCKHEWQWHTKEYGCLWHPPETKILESVCYCVKSIEDNKK